MPVPWEALIPFGLLTSMFAAAGTLFNTSKMAQNQGKPVRYNIDAWDQMMMERDRRLTGHIRGQKASKPAAYGILTAILRRDECVAASRARGGYAGHM